MLYKYLAFGQIIETDLNFDDTLLKALEGESTIKIIEKEIKENPRQLTKTYRKGVQARFGGDFTTTFLNWEGIAKYKIFEKGNLIHYQNCGADIGTFKLFTLSEALGCALWQKGIYLFHGSAVQINNYSHIFLGLPGAGKSTTATAFWKAGNTILSDDLTAVQFIDNQAVVLPSFPQLKVWKNALEGLKIDYSSFKNAFEGVEKFLISQPFDIFPAEVIPLKTITILQKHNSWLPQRQISALEAPVELLKHFPLPIQLLKQEQLKYHFKTSIRLAQLVDIQIINRPKNFEELEEFVEITKNKYFF